MGHGISRPRSTSQRNKNYKNQLESSLLLANQSDLNPQIDSDTHNDSYNTNVNNLWTSNNSEPDINNNICISLPKLKNCSKETTCEKIHTIVKYGPILRSAWTHFADFDERTGFDSDAIVYQSEIQTGDKNPQKAVSNSVSKNPRSKIMQKVPIESKSSTSSSTSKTDSELPSKSTTTPTDSQPVLRNKFSYQRKPVAPPVYIESSNRSSTTNKKRLDNNPIDRLKNVDVTEELLYYIPGEGNCSGNPELDYYCICNECGEMELVQCPNSEQRTSTISNGNPVKYSRRQRFNFTNTKIDEDDNDGPPFNWPGEAALCCCSCCRAGLRRSSNCCCKCCCAKGRARAVNSFDEIPVGKNPMPHSVTDNSSSVGKDPMPHSVTDDSSSAGKNPMTHSVTDDDSSAGKNPMTHSVTDSSSAGKNPIPHSVTDDSSAGEKIYEWNLGISDEKCDKLLPKESGVYFYDADEQRFVLQAVRTPTPIITQQEPKVVSEGFAAVQRPRKKQTVHPSVLPPMVIPDNCGGLGNMNYIPGVGLNNMPGAGINLLQMLLCGEMNGMNSGMGQINPSIQQSPMYPPQPPLLYPPLQSLIYPPQQPFFQPQSLPVKKTKKTKEKKMPNEDFNNSTSPYTFNTNPSNLM